MRTAWRAAGAEAAGQLPEDSEGSPGKGLPASEDIVWAPEHAAETTPEFQRWRGWPVMMPQSAATAHTDILARISEKPQRTVFFSLKHTDKAHKSAFWDKCQRLHQV